MLKLVTIGTVALIANAELSHPVSAEIVELIKTKATSWTPMEAHLNPLANHSAADLRARLGTIVRGPQGFP